MRKTAIALGATLCLMAAAALSPLKAGSNPKQKFTYAELSKAPAKDAARRNPLEGNPTAVEAGAKLYALHCGNCHGDLANGTRKAPSLRSAAVQQATPGALFWLLTNGVVRRGMPVWSKLPEPQRWQLVSFIRSLSQPPQSGAGTKADPR